MSETIHICYALTDTSGKYASILAASIRSVLVNTAEKLHIHILLDETVSENSRSYISDMVYSYVQNISFYDMRKALPDELKYIETTIDERHLKRYGLAVIYRLLFWQVIPHGIDKVIYLDCDTIANMNIADLWHRKCKHSIGAALDFVIKTLPGTNSLCEKGVLDKERYFNSGVLVMNRSGLWSSLEDSVNSIVSFLNRYPETGYPDQDILNYYAKGSFDELPYCFNTMVKLERFSEDFELSRSIYHFAGKCWYEKEDCYSMLWDKYYEDISVVSKKEYPVLFFSMNRDGLDNEQIKNLVPFETKAGPIRCETGIPGVLIDFVFGVRIEVPAGAWHIRIADADSGVVGFDGDLSETRLVSAEKYYIRWQVEIFYDGEKLFEHVMDLTGQRVLVFMKGGALGDTVALLPYILPFKHQHSADVYLCPPDSFKEICTQYFSEIPLTDDVPEDCYAAYCLAAFAFPPFLIPEDSRLLPINYAARSILGLNYDTELVNYTPTEKRRIKERYVCIAVQASGLKKRWLYPDGWNYVVDKLKNMGYRVLCIDGASYFEEDGYKIEIPKGAEDYTGMLPLMERINLLSYADFFVGLPSGLSWLANACGIPVVIISGFNLPMTEFDTPYRVRNKTVCHGCYNDIRVQWKDKCPKHYGTDRNLECTRMIHPDMVMEAIDRLIYDNGLGNV